MKKVLLILSVLLLTGCVGYHHHSRGLDILVPAIIGGAIVHGVTKQQAETPKCSPWTEVTQADGTIVRTRSCDK